MKLCSFPDAKEEKDTRYPLLIKREVLGGQDRGVQQGRRLRPQFPAELHIERLMVPHRRITVAQVDIHLAAALLRHLDAQSNQTLPTGPVGILLIGPQAALQDGFPADSVADGAGDHASKAQHPGRRQGLHQLQGAAIVVQPRSQGVPSLGGTREVDALAGDGDSDLISSGHQRPWACIDRSGGKSRPQVQSEYTLDMVLLQNSGGAQGTGTAKRLFCRLEEEEHIARQL